MRDEGVRSQAPTRYGVLGMESRCESELEAGRREGCSEGRRGIGRVEASLGGQGRAKAKKAKARYKVSAFDDSSSNNNNKNNNSKYSSQDEQWCSQVQEPLEQQQQQQP